MQDDDNTVANPEELETDVSAGGEPAPESEATTEPEPSEAPEPGESDESTEADEPLAASDDEPNKPRNRVQERIDQLTAQKRDLEARLAAREAEFARLNQPREEIDPYDWDAQERERIRSAVQETRAGEILAQAQVEQQQASAVQQQVFNAKIDAARDSIPDIDNALNQFYSLPVDDFTAGFIAESDRAPQIAVYLGRNPAEAIQLNSMHPVHRGVALARLEAKLQAAPKAKKVSTAPAPAKSLGGGASPSARDPNSMSTEEYRKWRMGSGA